MFPFTTEQKIFNINGVEIGGLPYERPIVLVSSIFYSNHAIVQDSQAGIFDEQKALELLKKEESLSTQTGVPRFIDVIGDTSEALIRYIEFITSHTDAPILVDSSSQKVRIEVIKHFMGNNLSSRLIYNSITDDFAEEELDCLKNAKIKNAIVLAFNMKAIKPERKLELLKSKLLPAATSVGIENILIDMGVVDVASISWISLAIREIKQALGYPVGCAPANALYDWKKVKEFGKKAFYASAAIVLGTIRWFGADFCLYGPIENASWVYPALASVDGLIAYGARLQGKRPISKEHPLYKIF